MALQKWWQRYNPLFPAFHVFVTPLVTTFSRLGFVTPFPRPHLYAMTPTRMEGQQGLSKGFLTLVAILLAFILMLVFIWVWYDLRLTALDKNTGNQKEIPSTNQ
jgi:hypothetical protein